MILTPATAPPPLQATSKLPPPSSSAGFPSVSCPPITIPTSKNETTKDSEKLDEDEEKGKNFLQRLTIPTVVLNTPTVSHTMAAALSLSLLGHTLYLKNQVPFPVAQLSLMPEGKSNSKATNKRKELLATFDLLATHLHTTFVALSTAYARCRQTQTENENALPARQGGGRPGLGTAHLMFVLGPSVNAARARIVLTIDNLEVKVWGAREVEEEAGGQDEGEDEEELDDEDSEADEDCEDDEEDTSDASDSDVDELDSASDPGSGEDALGDEDEEPASEPPSSRSPSPTTPPTRSLAPSPESLPSPVGLPTPLPSRLFAPLQPMSSMSSISAISAAPSTRPLQPSAPSSPVKPKFNAAPTSPQPAPSRDAPTLSYAEEQQALRAAERLLSRTLMDAWVASEGDMAPELAPTQTHVLLRAPRRFAHPAWAARQNLGRTLDAALAAFLVDAGAVPLSLSSSDAAKKKKGGKLQSASSKTEGAWIGCATGGSAFERARREAGAEARRKTGGESEEAESDEGGDLEEDEEDEEIWWVWDGKIVGFADW